MSSKRPRGFTMVELLIVLAIIAILAAIAVINYINGIQRARQKRTMADIRSIAMAWEARDSDMKGYNAAGFTLPANDVPASDMDTLLTPTYIRSLPQTDGWKHALKFSMDQPIGVAPAASYAIRSAGADGVFQTTYTPGPITSFDCDIVYSDGSFITYPAQ